MIPDTICLHYEPVLRRGCTAGLDAPHDCHGCPAYCDGEPYLGVLPEDRRRADAWAALRRVPVAHFRGQR